MGAKSTMDISRSEAIKALKNHLEHASDGEIADMLEAAVGDRLLANFWITDDSDTCASDFSYIYDGGIT